MDQLVLRPGCTADLRRRVVRVERRETSLTGLEVDLLQYLAARVGETVGFEALHREVWRHAPGTLSRAAFQTLRRLRTKLEPDPGRPRHLITVYGSGIRLVTEDSAPVAPSLFGRTEELAALREAIGRERLVTVCGLGGVGKTALVRALERERASEVVWVDLARTTTELEVVAALGEALQLDDRSAIRVAWTLAALGPVLVVLDEAEHATEPLRRLLAGWLDRAPEARFLTTSRIPLRVYGEHLVALGPLPLPAPTDSPAEVAANPAVQAWRARARVPVGQDRIVGLVRATEGYPLAIALAAAHPDPTAPAPAGADPVDRAIGWAWSALSSDARAVLAGCSVFEGEVTIEALEAVVAGASWAVDAVEELVDASLLVRRGTRFSLLDRTRRFAAARLPDREATEARHGAWFARFAEVRAGVPGEWLDDARVGCSRALSRGDGELAAACAVAAARRLDRTGPFPLAVDLLRSVVDRTGDARAELWLGWMEFQNEDATGLARLEAVERRSTDPAIRGAALHRAGRILHAGGRADAAGRVLEEALGALRAAGDTDAEVEVLGLLGAVALVQGRTEIARARCREGLRHVVDGRAEGQLLATLAKLHNHCGDHARGVRMLQNAAKAFRDAGDLASEGEALGAASQMTAELGRWDEARALEEAALAIHRSVGSRRGWGRSLLHLGTLDHAQGRHDEAVARISEAREILADAGDVVWVGNGLVTWAAVLYDVGRLDEAAARLQEAIALRSEAGSTFGVAAAQLVLVRVLTDLGRDDEALDAAQRAQARFQEAGAVRSQLLVELRVADLRRRRGELAEARAQLEQTLERARDHALSPIGVSTQGTLARVDLAEGRWDDAVARLDEIVPKLRVLGDRPNTVIALALLADALRGLGRLDAARERLAEADALARAMPLSVPVAHLACIRAKVALAAGDRGEAARALDEARQLAPPPRSEVGQLLAALEAALDRADLRGNSPSPPLRVRN